MRPKPFKGTVARTPMRQPPSADTLERTGCELMKMKRNPPPEDGVRALRRAEPIASKRGLRIVETAPYWSGSWWLFVCRRETEAA